MDIAARRRTPPSSSSRTQPSLTVAYAIFSFSALSFFGLVLPPRHADWGAMLPDGLNCLFGGYWWLVYPPAVILIVTVVGFNLIGEAVRDWREVRLQRS